MADDERKREGDRVDAAVIGAGLSGLVVAHALQRSGHRVIVVESSDRSGGVIGTRERDGFLYETAANSALDDSPALSQLIEALGIAGERVGVQARAAKRYIVRDGRLRALPTSPPALLGSDAFSLRAKLRLLREPLIARASPHSEETVAEFTRRRLGDEWLDYAIDPFVSGVHAGDPEALSLRAAFPRLHALEQAHGSILLGQVRRARERKGAPAPKSFSFLRGMRTLTDALARTQRVITGARASIAPAPDGSFRIEAGTIEAAMAVDARAVVVATPADATATLVAPFAPPAAAMLDAIRYAPVSIVVAAYRRDHVAHPLDGFGVLAPSREHRPILGTLFSSSMFQGRAPQDCALLTTFVGGQRAPGNAALDDARLRDVVAGELASLLGAREPIWMDIVRWPRAIPQYTLGHEARVAAIDQAIAAYPALFLSANWRGGVSVGDCVAQSMRTASRVRQALDVADRARS